MLVFKDTRVIGIPVLVPDELLLCNFLFIVLPRERVNALRINRPVEVRGIAYTRRWVKRNFFYNDSKFFKAFQAAGIQDADSMTDSILNTFHIWLDEKHVMASITDELVFLCKFLLNALPPEQISALRFYSPTKLRDITQIRKWIKRNLLMEGSHIYWSFCEAGIQNQERMSSVLLDAFHMWLNKRDANQG